jgi:hypothetical protein
MSRSVSENASFRPQLERLEGREMPSTLGFFLPTLIQPVVQATNQLTSQLNTMNSDFSKLQKDATAAAGAFNQTIASDYAKLGNDFGQITALNSQVKAQVSADQTFLFLLAFSGALDQSDTFFLFSAFNTLSNDLSSANSTLSSANSVANTAPATGYPSLNTALS